MTNYIISESKLESFFQTYLEKLYPYLDDLEQTSIMRSVDGVRQEVLGWRFRDSEGKEYFRWFLEGPTLQVEESFWSELGNVFAMDVTEFFVKWFKTRYELPVSSIYIV